MSSLLRLTVCLSAWIVLTGCEFHRSENGTLDGFWQLTSVDTLSTGGSTDLRHSQISWSVQGYFLQLRHQESGLTVPTNIIARFRHTADSLFVFDFCKSAHEASDVPVTDVTQLHHLGISQLEETFLVLQLDHKYMTLRSDRLCLHFRRY